MNLVTTGQSTSARLERNTITTAGRRCPSGRSPKNGWRGRYNHLTRISCLYTFYFNLCHVKVEYLANVLYLCFTENIGKKRQQRLRLSTVSPKTGTTEERLCKHRQPLASLVQVSVTYTITTHIIPSVCCDWYQWITCLYILLFGFACPNYQASVFSIMVQIYLKASLSIVVIG